MARKFRNYARRARPIDLSIGHLKAAPESFCLSVARATIQQLLDAIEERRALADCLGTAGLDTPFGLTLAEEIEHLGRSVFDYSPERLDDHNTHNLFTRIRSGQQPLIRPGQSAETPQDNLRRTFHNAAATTDWSEPQRQGLEPHPFLAALLAHDPLDCIDTLREAAVALWATYIGRFWRTHCVDNSYNGGQLLPPWHGPLQATFATTIHAWLQNNPSALHPGWRSNPQALDALLNSRFTNPGYRLTVATAMAKPREFTFNERPGFPSDYGVAADAALLGGFSLDPLSLPDWFAPARYALWRSKDWFKAEKNGTDVDDLSWGIHRNREASLRNRRADPTGPRFSAAERAGIQSGQITLLSAIDPTRFQPKPKGGRVRGSKNKAFYPRGPRDNTPEAIAAYEDRLQQNALKTTEAQVKARVLRDAEENGVDPRIAIHLAVQDGRLPRQSGRPRKYTEPKPPTPPATPQAKLRLAMGLAMGVSVTAHLEAQPVAWSQAELDGSIPHPLVRALLDPSIPDQVVTKACQERDLAFRLLRNGQGFGGQWIANGNLDPDWATACAERWWPANPVQFAQPGTHDHRQGGSVADNGLVGTGEAAGPLQARLVALEQQHAELMERLEKTNPQYNPDAGRLETEEECEDRLDALEAEADRVWDEMDALRSQAETELSSALSSERQRFEQLLSPYAWLDPRYCAALRAALEEAQNRNALSGTRLTLPEKRLPQD